MQDIAMLHKCEKSIIKIQAFTREVLTRCKMNDLLHRDGGPLINRGPAWPRAGPVRRVRGIPSVD